MIRILVQQNKDGNTKNGYQKSYQFVMDDRMTDDLALQLLLYQLRFCDLALMGLLKESKHTKKK
jgi:hypothetical protein